VVGLEFNFELVEPLSGLLRNSSCFAGGIKRNGEHWFHNSFRQDREVRRLEGPVFGGRAVYQPNGLLLNSPPFVAGPLRGSQSAWNSRPCLSPPQIARSITSASFW